MYRKIITLSFLLVLVALIIGCSERDNNIVRDDYPTSYGESPYTAKHEFDNELGFSMFYETRTYRALRFRIYVPPDYKDINEGTPYPVLYMLSPYGETEMFFFAHSLQEVADRMIGTGQIKPMIIVCVNGYNGYGGTFYGNSWAGGKYIDILGNIEGDPATGSLIDYVDDTWNTISDSRYGAEAGRANRAITGVGMGGYGAMRTAITHSDNYGAVSAISAPLDFDGATGEGGFVEMFAQILNNLEPTYSEDDLTLSDTLRTTFMAMDTSYSDQMRTMVYAAATSFSPHDTDYINPQFYPYDWQNPTAPQLWNSDDTLRIEDTLTYFEPFGPISSMKYHLPFYNDVSIPGVNDDYTYQPIWSLWLDNNLENILADNPTALDNTDVLLITTADARYNFYQQTLDFSSHLTDMGITHSLNTFEGYDGYEAAGERFFYDIVQDILKYHSDRFESQD